MSGVERLSTAKWVLPLMIAMSGGPAMAAGPEDLDPLVAASLPPEVFDSFAGLSGYAFESRLNPFYLQGDFDGDGLLDMAVLIRARATGKHGIAVALTSGPLVVAGAGQRVGNGGGDFDWMDAWYVQRKGPVEEGADPAAPPRLKGDAIKVVKTDSASAIIWWDGRRLRWYQQGD